MMTTTDYHSSDQVFLRSEIFLLGSVETMLGKIYEKHKQHRPITVETRRRLSSISEELALETLRKVFNMQYVKTLDGLITYFVKDMATVDGSPRLSSGESPVQSPTTPGKKSCRPFQDVSLDGETPSPKFLRREENGGSKHIPLLLALGELEFKKAFLLLTYIGGKSLDEVISGDEIRKWKDLPMISYERAVWFKLGQNERRMSPESDSGKTHYYQCQVAPDGSYRFKGYHLENTGTHLHKVLGDDNVLTFKFDQLPKESIYCNNPYSKYKEIAKNGIMVGLRRYQFFVFKDGGKAEKKKKRNSTKQVKCYFIRTDSTALSDMENPYILSGMSIHEARMHFMHVHTLPSPANYMARFSLILSKTKKLEIDMTGITVKQIDDIHCHDQSNNDVLDKNGKPRIHSDGTGYISEDLAGMCPVNIYQGKDIKSDIIEGTCGQEPPLLIQIRMFNDGFAVKGILLLNKNLPPRTVQVRPSMIKVYKDKTLSNFSTFNSLEVVTTSNPPRRTKLSKNLVALLSYGGVPNDFFLDILLNTLEKTKTIFFKKRAAVKAALYYGDMDDKNALQMIMAGIPLDEPYLKHRLSILLKTEKDGLKAGRLPIGESYYLMGTVDPTGELKENEVCVILESGQISGDVLVYRNPGLHFGDIHILKATYVKTLEQYVGNSKYAVFFPQKGPRSLGDEIAGGDFDGDMYFISRNPKLLKHYKPSEPWVSSSPPSKIYTGRKPSELTPEQLEEELFKMFLKTGFSPSKVIGQAADSWLAIMDRFLTLGDESVKEKAEMRKKMLKLTDIYYDALDAPKTGTEVNLPLDVKIEVFPHYMERDKLYNSTSILGLIFDTVDSHNAEKPPPSEISKLQCFEDEPVSEFDMEKCKSWHKDYRKEMCQAMNSDEDSCDEVVQRYKQEFYGAAGFKESKRSLEELYPKALALYNITYDYAIKWNNVKSCGFVWKVAGPVLCRFYAKNSIMCSISVLKEIFG
ncbi:RNA-dependent RNA polymerase eukaryotic-type [Arabidopsis thaliana x Arabidopsis arenosa]|uniref:RNA-dependent RNA polymerase n=1 Tax=Arabidopsis thaliana x Arabidopsis arenosa TaxID=1240361 RepID=A0A8T2AZY1_9BRAS|nr:RNA-dependent RNA polymerase eukaryotic-type [Arabidopsis thaliana x Arabidopsis arenosa]